MVSSKDAVANVAGSYKAQGQKVIRKRPPLVWATDKDDDGREYSYAASRWQEGGVHFHYQVDQIIEPFEGRPATRRIWYVVSGSDGELIGPREHDLRFPTAILARAHCQKLEDDGVLAPRPCTGRRAAGMRLLHRLRQLGLPWPGPHLPGVAQRAQGPPVRHR
jgi:hypothetical protein